ncbi:hypothetical protein [Nannocystis pusilla]|uniref:hypothetical protein n=1 Tax=Nannocystis pusilla TaxID=889268 RepID=UPI003B77A12B
MEPPGRHREPEYGLTNYNALVNAYRAFYSGDARTIQGTQVFFRDVAHSPPMFDQVDPIHLPPAPIFGSYNFLLESVYDDASGAACRSYTPHLRTAYTATPPTRPRPRVRRSELRRLGQHGQLRRQYLRPRGSRLGRRVRDQVRLPNPGDPSS